MRVIATALLMASLLWLTRPASPQNPIKVDVNLVNVTFTARDTRGALIENLTKDDVEVFEDAVPQKIEFFAKSTDLPLTLALLMDVSGSQERVEREHQKDLEVFLDEFSQTASVEFS
jgi:VWFA-related protein